MHLHTSLLSRQCSHHLLQQHPHTRSKWQTVRSSWHFLPRPSNSQQSTAIILPHTRENSLRSSATANQTQEKCKMPGVKGGMRSWHVSRSLSLAGAMVVQLKQSYASLPLMRWRTEMPENTKLGQESSTTSSETSPKPKIWYAAGVESCAGQYG